MFLKTRSFWPRCFAGVRNVQTKYSHQPTIATKPNPAKLTRNAIHAKNVLATSLVQNDRLSVQRERMQPFNRSTSIYMLYTHLGLKPDATLKDIKSAYYYLAKMYHPDAKNSRDSVARQKFLQISEAYEVLSDDKRRLEYDQKQAVLTRMSMVGKGAERVDTFHQKPVEVHAAPAGKFI